MPPNINPECVEMVMEIVVKVMVEIVVEVMVLILLCLDQMVVAVSKLCLHHH